MEIRERTPRVSVFILSIKFSESPYIFHRARTKARLVAGGYNNDKYIKAPPVSTIGSHGRERCNVARRGATRHGNDGEAQKSRTLVKYIAMTSDEIYRKVVIATAKVNLSDEARNIHFRPPLPPPSPTHAPNPPSYSAIYVLVKPILL